MLCEAVSNNHWVMKDTAQYETHDDAPVHALKWNHVSLTGGLLAYD